jgi:hypothetical protein
MSSITIDNLSADVLRQCARRVLVRDATGKVIGYFEPVTRYDPKDIPEFDEEEIKRRVDRWEGMPSAEVRRRLEELM